MKNLPHQMTKLLPASALLLSIAALLQSSCGNSAQEKDTEFIIIRESAQKNDGTSPNSGGTDNAGGERSGGSVPVAGSPTPPANAEPTVVPTVESTLEPVLEPVPTAKPNEKPVIE